MRLTRCILVLMAAAALWATGRGGGFAAAYLAASLPPMLAIVLAGRLRRYGEVLLAMIAITLWCFYLVRPLVLYGHPEYFKFLTLYGAGQPLQVATLWRLAAMNAVMLASAALVLRAGGWAATSRLVRADQIGGAGARLAAWLLPVGWLYLAVSLVAVARPETGEQVIGLIELALPVKIIPVLAAALIVCGAQARLTPRQRRAVLTLAALYLLAQLFQGSKSFILELTFLGMVMLLFLRGDVVLPPGRILRLGALGAAIFISFPVAMALRRIAAESGFAGLGPTEMLERIRFMAATLDYDGVATYVTDLFTKRLNGYDGMLAALQIEPHAVPRDLSAGVLFENAMAATLPGVHSAHDSFGQITSQLFYSIQLDGGAHGGGIGAYAMLQMFAGNHPAGALAALALYGALSAGLLVLAARLRAPPVLRLVMIGALVMAFVVATSGGNFDRSFRDLVGIALQSLMVLAALRMRIGRRLRRARPREAVHEAAR